MPQVALRFSVYDVELMPLLNPETYVFLVEGFATKGLLGATLSIESQMAVILMFQALASTPPSWSIHLALLMQSMPYHRCKA